MPASIDPSTLTPNDRFGEIAHLLATGLLRLAAPIIASGTAPRSAAKTLPDSPANELAVSPQKSVTVHAG